MLEFASPQEASSLYDALHTTLSLCIVNYRRPEDTGDPMAQPGEKTLEAWYFTLELLQKLHAIAVERLSVSL